MALNISEELKRTFELATLKYVASKNLSGNDWQGFQVITESFTARRDEATQAFAREYDTRVEIARKHLIDKAGEKDRQFRHPWSRTDAFDKSAISRQAHRHVRNAHYQLMGSIDEMERRDLRGFIERVEARSGPLPGLDAVFARTADRRGRDGLPEDRRRPRART